MPKKARVVTWTQVAGVVGVTDPLPAARAVALARDLVASHPLWLHVYVEGVDDEGRSVTAAWNVN